MFCTRAGVDHFPASVLSNLIFGAASSFFPPYALETRVSSRVPLTLGVTLYCEFLRVLLYRMRLSSVDFEVNDCPSSRPEHERVILHGSWFRQDAGLRSDDAPLKVC